MANQSPIKLSQKEFQECLKLSQDRLESARILAKAGKYRDSISRSYYAFFDIVAALLAIKGLIPKTHAGALQMFSLHYVKSGIFSREYGKVMRDLLEARQEADYEWKTEFSLEEAEEAIKEVEEFLKVVKEKIPHLFSK